MHCRNCGKELDTEAEFCNKCLTKFDDFGDDGEKIVENLENEKTFKQTATDSSNQSTPITYQQKNSTSSQPQGSIMAGFGLALTGSILSVVGFTLIMFGFSIASMLNEAVFVPAETISYFESILKDMIIIAEESFESLKTTAWFMWISGLGVSIPSLIFSIKSIIRFAVAKRKDLKRPIPAFAIGIETIAMLVIVLYFVLVSLEMLLSI
ncbi:MAG: zinc ribbon domain-containing protein [Clostridia bacterium]|nr:zinc ribbon domain-containing protein [Clostridia bacterium]